MCTRKGGQCFDAGTATVSGYLIINNGHRIVRSMCASVSF